MQQNSNFGKGKNRNHPFGKGRNQRNGGVRNPRKSNMNANMGFPNQPSQQLMQPGLGFQNQPDQVLLPPANGPGMGFPNQTNPPFMQPVLGLQNQPDQALLPPAQNPNMALPNQVNIPFMQPAFGIPNIPASNKQEDQELIQPNLSLPKKYNDNQQKQQNINKNKENPNMDVPNQENQAPENTDGQFQRNRNQNRNMQNRNESREEESDVKDDSSSQNRNTHDDGFEIKKEQNAKDEIYKKHGFGIESIFSKGLNSKQRQEDICPSPKPNLIAEERTPIENLTNSVEDFPTNQFVVSLFESQSHGWNESDAFYAPTALFSITVEDCSSSSILFPILTFSRNIFNSIDDGLCEGPDQIRDVMQQIFPEGLQCEAESMVTSQLEAGLYAVVVRGFFSPNGENTLSFERSLIIGIEEDLILITNDHFFFSKPL